MPRSFRRVVVWTNIFYIIPFVVAVYHQLWWVAGSVALLIAFSFAFHFYREKRFIFADFVAAGLVAVFCLALVYWGGLQSGYVLLALLLIAAELYIRYWLEKGRRNGLTHGLWHLVAAITILSCMFSYIG